MFTVLRGKAGSHVELVLSFEAESLTPTPALLLVLADSVQIPGQVCGRPPLASPAL